MEAKKINQKEYLKRYLYNKDDDKKKKKKKLKVGPRKVQIIDDDIDLNKLTSIDDEEISIFNATEDAPQIVGIIDERGPADFENKQRWKVIADDGCGDIAIQQMRQPKKISQENGERVLGSKADKLQKKSLDKASKKKKDESSSDSDSENDKPRKDKKTESSKKNRNKHHSTSESDSEDSNYNKEKMKRKKSGNKKKDSDSDLSPPRDSKKSKNTSKRRQDNDSDLSPPRDSKRKESRGKNTSRGRQGSDSDLSPARPSKKSNQSPPRRRRSQSQDSDLSPPRQNKNNNSSKSHKNSRSIRTQNKSDSDLSPPRSKKSKNSKNSDGSDSDLSPPRNPRQDRRESDKNSDRRPKSRWDDHSKTSHSSERSRSSNVSSKYSDSRSNSSRWDNDRRKSGSPSRNHRSDSHRRNNDRAASPASSVASQTKKKKMLDGRSAGLTNLQTLMEEDKARKRREEEQLRNMSREESGYGQATIVRGRKRRDMEQNAAEERERQKEQDEINEKYAKWGKGLKQGVDREDRLKSDLHEMSKPLARYAGDADLESELRARDREDDPLLAYIREREIKSGKRAPEKPKFEGSYMPNRFGIKPGYRWDGLDRSNGYEKKWFEAQNTKKAVEVEAYQYLTADM